MDVRLLKGLREALCGLGTTSPAIALRLGELGVRGLARTPDCCPVARYLQGMLPPGVSVEVTAGDASFFTQTADGACRFWGGFTLPLPTSDFVMRFDNGEYAVLRGA